MKITTSVTATKITISSKTLTYSIEVNKPTNIMVAKNGDFKYFDLDTALHGFSLLKNAKKKGIFTDSFKAISNKQAANINAKENGFFENYKSLQGGFKNVLKQCLNTKI